MTSLWRTLSGSTGKEITHQHPLRPCQSIDINAGALPTQQQCCRFPCRCHGLQGPL